LGQERISEEEELGVGETQEVWGKAAGGPMALWPRRKALLWPLLTLFMALGRPLYFPSLGLLSLFCEMGRRSSVPWGWVLLEVPRAISRKAASLAEGALQSQPMATSAPGLWQPLGGHRALGFWPRKVGPALE
jgi:hypothetical protein